MIGSLRYSLPKMATKASTIGSPNIRIGVNREVVLDPVCESKLKVKIPISNPRNKDPLSPK